MFLRLRSCFDEETYGEVGGTPSVRTSRVPAVPPKEALRMLKEGNARYVGAKSCADRAALAKYRKQFVAHGQKPIAAVFGCADLRAPLDTIFDAIPGDLFALQHAGNTCSNAEGSMVGFLEYAISHLDTKLILVLGHSKCGAVAGATKTTPAQKAANSVTRLEKVQSALEILLGRLVPVAEKALGELAGGASEEEVVNVLSTMSGLFKYSSTVRRMVQSGEVQVHGGVYDLETRSVEFLGQHPDQEALIESHPEVVGCHGCAHDSFDLAVMGA